METPSQSAASVEAPANKSCPRNTHPHHPSPYACSNKGCRTRCRTNGGETSPVECALTDEIKDSQRYDGLRGGCENEEERSDSANEVANLHG